MGNTSVKPLNSRNYGIDLLRIISMLMIVTLHVLGQGGILKSTIPMSTNYEVAWFLEMLCYGAVNCYGLISGYVGCNSKFKYSNIVYLWLQVAFYAVFISGATALLKDYGVRQHFFDGFMPVWNDYYWYFTAYFCMFFFIPVLNKILNSLNDKQLKVLALSIFLLFSFMPNFAEKDLFFTNRGYSAIWLTLLYLLGGIIKKCNLLSKIKPWILAFLYFLFSFITWLEKYIVQSHNIELSGSETVWTCHLFSYTSPTVLLGSIMLLIMFSKINIGKITSKIIAFFAPLSFSVYLIHVHRCFWKYIMAQRFVDFATFSPFKMIIAVIISSISIYLFCVAIDFIREKIFSLLKIKKGLNYLENKFLGDIW